MAGHIVTAGYVTAETAVPGGRAYIDIPRGSRLPDDVPAEQVLILLGLGAIEPIPDAEAPAVADPVDVDDAPVMVPTGTIAEVLDWVGDDPVLAGLAHQVEQGHGDKARSTLLAQLSAIAQSDG